MPFVSDLVYKYLTGEVKFYFLLVAGVSAFFIASGFHSKQDSKEHNSNILMTNLKNADECSCAELKISETDYPYEWLSEYSLAPWESMGTDVRQICSAVLPYRYEWGVQYNNRGPILRVTCNMWNNGYRVCSYPQYPTADAEPFDWGGVCWIWYTASSWDDACSVAYHSYYYYNTAGKLYMAGGNGCDQLPSVYRRLLW